ncbi:thiol:disulfide interchange protein DsbG [Janthinobacterium agaricidamnosum]|uniref:Thiol:disulfide interchange protein n=1 Tax=Janthinobacterium agaricidamnosum NBRC 102515 = DSM 9628 TaxID=1349767 RepID=W0V703_9BURK|nr:thiol:disulfide interchange protein DsbG [Janthinobacterium agaricidamnosum]CDG83661.1 disulfide isomerase/thiol-disulfide oxidase [Janthinobacterium agaricidamnosum NBRC 102515 = DSM 9628]
MSKLTILLAPALCAIFGNAVAAPAGNWPAPVKAIEAQGVEIVGRFDAPGGLQGYAAMVQQRPLAIYLTADGKQAIVGTMIDAKGANLSEAPLQKLVSKPMADKTWSLLEKSAWIADGSKEAKQVVYAFTDPNCPYCNKFWNNARPWVKAGKVQIRHVMVGVIRDTSPGKAAALLASKDPQAALAQHELNNASGGIQPLDSIAPAQRAQLDGNQKIMQQLGFSGTPAILYKDASGNLQTLRGVPPPEVMEAMMEPKK